MPEGTKPSRKPWFVVGAIVLVIVVFLVLPHDLRGALTESLRSWLIKLHSAARG